MGVGMLKTFFLGLIAAVLIFCAYVAMLPAEFRIERSATIAASPEQVFPHINDLRKWQAWSPWAKMDPNAKATFEGPEAGKGAIFNWAGNNQVGEGRMTIIDSRPNEAVQIKLDFLKPWPASNIADFTLVPDGEQTKVTWAMSGQQGFIEKAVCVFMNMDRMVGGEFEKGLANLNAVVAAPSGS